MHKYPVARLGRVGKIGVFVIPISLRKESFVPKNASPAGLFGEQSGAIGLSAVDSGACEHLIEKR